MSGTLFLVATPIGNLDDVTHRAIETLRTVTFIACEDTRHSRILLDRFGISKPTVSLPAFAEGERAGRLIERMVAGEDCALITDAGSPGISDPGEVLVREAVAAGVRVVPIPGPSALVSALSASGLSTSRFHFLGFLPRKGPERVKMLEEVAPLSATLAIYESPRRLVETLGDVREALGDRPACVARELTKLHEEFARGTLGELAQHFSRGEVKGEVVLLVEGRRGEVRWSEEEVKTALGAGLARGERLKSLATEIARQAGWNGQDVYKLGLTLKA